MANLSASDNGSAMAAMLCSEENGCTQPVNSTHQARVTALIQVVIVSFTSRAATGYTVVCSGMRLKVFTVRPETSVSVSVCWLGNTFQSVGCIFSDHCRPCAWTFSSKEHPVNEATPTRRL
ncbi:hypothetical protein D9C73_000776 [Collichthys lucidus]|uniref:Uncharacterized protein n=1 Tax=Collichthys lucidus TaxID=240159 RepID=A0A4U5U285_COLLU|nr:hypothetical protein D9C73_000776 [Collichthys lucidus]